MMTMYSNFSKTPFRRETLLLIRKGAADIDKAVPLIIGDGWYVNGETLSWSELSGLYSSWCFARYILSDYLDSIYPETKQGG